MTSAARRASWASSRVQQPRAPDRYDEGLRERARWMPVTSCPASAARAAATAESTPPDMAAMTRTSAHHRVAGRARPVDARADRGDQGVDVGVGARVAEGEAQRAERVLLGQSHRHQHVRRLGDAGRAGRPGGALDAARVEELEYR